MTYFYDPCDPCCEEGGIVTSNCLQCIDQIIAVRYQVTLSGITSGTCSSNFCNTQLNKTWTLETLTQCVRADSDSTYTCFGAGINVGLTFLVPTSITLDITIPGVAVIARYRKTTSAPHDCLANHTLTQLFGLTHCSNWPSSVTVSPV